MLPSSRWLGVALYTSSFALLAACAGSETNSVEQPVEADEEDGDEEPVRDAGRPRDASQPRIDAGNPVTPPRQDANVAPTPRDASTPPRDATVAPTPDAGPPPNPFAPGDRTPDPNNIPECPKVAPENPIGDCLGIPVYAVCSYTTYTCICDWYHWLCI